MNNSEILNKAADLIEEHGWTEGTKGMALAYPEVCLEGAIQAARGAKTFAGMHGETYHYLGTDPCPAGQAVADYLGTDVGSVFLWNDDSTEERVVGVLRATALIEQVREGAPVSILETVSA